MKTLGLIGGTSYHSTIDYYRLINQKVNERLGGLHSAKLFLYSVDFEEVRPPADPALWKGVPEFFTLTAQKLEAAGAECIVLCANTAHLMADKIQQGISIPLIHIVEATATAIKQQGLKKVALLGTKFTMEQPFFSEGLKQHGIEAIIPNDKDRDFINASIFDEMTKGIFSPGTKQRYFEIIENLQQQQVEAVIFACTEIPMLIKQDECPLPVFDTTLIHVEAAVNFALGN
jgi:aspartate racemase